MNIVVEKSPGGGRGMEKGNRGQWGEGLKIMLTMCINIQNIDCYCIKGFNATFL